MFCFYKCYYITKYLTLSLKICIIFQLSLVFSFLYNHSNVCMVFRVFTPLNHIQREKERDFKPTCCNSQNRSYD